MTKKISVLVLLVASLFLLSACGSGIGEQNKAVSIVKNGKLDSGKTIGKVFDKVSDDKAHVQWLAFKPDDTEYGRAPAGSESMYAVDVNVNMSSGAVIRVQFSTDIEKETYELNYIDVNGQPAEADLETVLNGGL